MPCSSWANSKRDVNNTRGHAYYFSNGEGVGGGAAGAPSPVPSPATRRGINEGHALIYSPYPLSRARKGGQGGGPAEKGAPAGEGTTPADGRRRRTCPWEISAVAVVVRNAADFVDVLDGLLAVAAAPVDFAVVEEKQLLGGRGGMWLWFGGSTVWLVPVFHVPKISVGLEGDRDGVCQASASPFSIWVSFPGIMFQQHIMVLPGWLPRRMLTGIK
eukprot:Gb_40508 [translate_table: standard]